MKPFYIVLMVMMAALTVPNVSSAGPPPSSTFVAPLDSDSEVPPNNSRAVGAAIFKVTEDGMAIEYKLIVANIENVVAAHIHIGPAGVNGQVVAFLFGPAPA